MQTTWALVITLWLGVPALGIVTPQQDAPSAATSEQQVPNPATDNGSFPAAQPPLKAAPTAAPGSPPPTSETETTKPPAKKNTTKRHKHPPQTSAGTPLKVVVREGGANEPAAQIAPGMTPAEAARERQNAERWFGSADSQLKQLAGRTLNGQQQETVGQIRNYTDGARAALKEGDVGRASTLAQKAYLLSDDLVKH
jgi:hypothetical protein